MSTNIGKTREVCWDFYLVDKKENIDLKLHKPVRKNIVMTLDKKVGRELLRLFFSA